MGVMTRLLLLLWVAVMVSTAVDLHKRVIQGYACPPGERGYHVRLEATNLRQQKFLCGGSLISDRWVLTAAHCKEWFMKAEISVHPGRGNITKVQKKVVFEEKKNFFISKKHDIMLLKLKEAAVGVTPIDLPNKDECRTRCIIDSFQIAGHAATFMGLNNERGDNMADVLQCADIPQIDLQPHTTGHHLCAFSNQADATHGDSGGGMVHNGKIYGVISFTENATHACVAPFASMDVCAYMDWIKETTGIP